MEENIELQRSQLLQQKNIKPEEQSLDKQKEEESLPKMSLNIYYSEHYYPEDWHGLKKKLMETDIYVPEQFGWTRESLDFFNNVSFGRISLEEAEKAFGDSYPFRSSILELFRIIHNSGKPITSVDVPSDHSIHKEIKDLHDSSNYLLEGNLPIMKFTDVLERIKNLALNAASLEKQREEYMLSCLRPQIQKVLEDYPDLKEKD